MGKKKKLKELVKRLRDENDDLKAELEDRLDQVLAYGEKLCALRETHAMQLAAISTASIQNTMSTIRDRIDYKSPFYTQAYSDVCAAVDREMVLIESLSRDNRLKRYLAFYRDQGMKFFIGSFNSLLQAKDALYEAVNSDGKSWDTEWGMVWDSFRSKEAWESSEAVLVGGV